jgi:hypothetical protein
MAGAVAGGPIAIRFVDNRTIDNVKDPQMIDALRHEDPH